jgi:hypothetical protein
VAVAQVIGCLHSKPSKHEALSSSTSTTKKKNNKSLGGEMTQALYAHMNNKTIRIKKKKKERVCESAS